MPDDADIDKHDQIPSQSIAVSVNKNKNKSFDSFGETDIVDIQQQNESLHELEKRDVMKRKPQEPLHLANDNITRCQHDDKQPHSEVNDFQYQLQQEQHQYISDEETFDYQKHEEKKNGFKEEVTTDHRPRIV